MATGNHTTEILLVRIGFG